MPIHIPFDIINVPWLQEAVDHRPDVIADLVFKKSRNQEIKKSRNQEIKKSKSDVLGVRRTSSGGAKLMF